MNNLKKIIAMLVCVALVFSFAACAKQQEETPADDNYTTTAPAGENSSDDDTTEPEKVTDTADTTKEDGKTDNTTKAEEAASKEDTTDPASDPHYVENKTKFDTTKHVFVTFVIKDMGEFQVELYPEYAPNTVTNFVNLADSGFYNGTKFHRVVDDFMAQGGINTSAEPDSIYGEFQSNGFDKNTLHHSRGVISMARATAPDSASGQFFICYTDCDFLDGNYAAFGKVTYGMDVLDSFLDVERAMNSMGELATPLEDIIIEKAVVSQ